MVGKFFGPESTALAGADRGTFRHGHEKRLPRLSQHRVSDPGGYLGMDRPVAVDVPDQFTARSIRKGTGQQPN